MEKLLEIEDYRAKMGIRSKMKIFESAILPVITHGTQTWALTK